MLHRYYHRLRIFDGYFLNSLRPISYLGYIWLGLKTKVFFVEKKQVNDRNHGKGTHSAKLRADKSAEDTPNTPKFICPIGQKVWDIVKKGFIGFRSQWILLCSRAFLNGPGGPAEQ